MVRAAQGLSVHPIEECHIPEGIEIAVLQHDSSSIPGKEPSAKWSRIRDYLVLSELSAGSVDVSLEESANSSRLRLRA